MFWFCTVWKIYLLSYIINVTVEAYLGIKMILVKIPLSPPKNNKGQVDEEIHMH